MKAPQKHRLPSVARKSPRSYHDWYKMAIWRGLRRRQLDRQPLCEACLRKDRIEPATVVDHIRPHRGDWTLFTDPENLQSLSEACHNSKTAGGQ